MSGVAALLVLLAIPAGFMFGVYIGKTWGRLPDLTPGAIVTCKVTNAWGEWITGRSDQVTCPGCLETVHA